MEKDGIIFLQKFGKLELSEQKSLNEKAKMENRVKERESGQSEKTQILNKIVI